MATAALSSSSAAAPGLLPRPAGEGERRAASSSALAAAALAAASASAIQALTDVFAEATAAVAEPVPERDRPGFSVGGVCEWRRRAKVRVFSPFFESFFFQSTA